jgi:hypothetical protein
MKLLRLILILVLFCSCSTLKKSVKPESFIELTPANIGLINGRYEVNSTRNIRSNVDDLHWIIFDRGYNKKNSTEFIKLKSLSCKKILITHYDGDSIVKSKIFHGKIKDGYFQFRRKWLVIPMIIANLYRNRMLRIGILENNDLTTDYGQISFELFYFIIPGYSNEHSNNSEFKRIENN